MRLKTRILLIACALLISAVAICCLLILRNVNEQMRTEALQKATSDFRNVQQTVTRFDSLHQDQMIDDAYFLYLVRSTEFARELTLKNDERYLLNDCGFSPESYLIDSESAEDGVASCFCRVFGKLYLLIGQRYKKETTTYSVCIVRNLSELDSIMRTLALRCIVIAALMPLVFLILLYLFVSLSLQPIRQMQMNARAIASGDYSARIAVKRKDEIGLLADDFNTMAQAVDSSIAALTEQNLRKQQFINDLSHEMKTPVTSLLINSETLMTRSVTDSEAQHALYRIHEQSKWIECLSQKLMTLILLQDKITLIPHTVFDLFEAVEERIQDSLQRAKIKMIIQSDQSVYSMDFDLMQSALVNLIENAIKASQENSTIEMKAQENVIVVRDHGCGIPKEEISRITEPFYMVDRSRSKKFGGSGLGLALVQRIAELHHAELQIESEVDVGTSIFFRFYDTV